MKNKTILLALAIAIGYGARTLADTNQVTVINDVSQLVPTTMPEDVLPAFMAGFGFGLTIWGFGWIYRIVFRGVRAATNDRD